MVPLGISEQLGVPDVSIKGSLEGPLCHTGLYTAAPDCEAQSATSAEPGTEQLTLTPGWRAVGASGS